MKEIIYKFPSQYLPVKNLLLLLKTIIEELPLINPDIPEFLLFSQTSKL